MKYKFSRHQLIYLLKRYRETDPDANNTLLSQVYDNNLTSSASKENQDLVMDANRSLTIDGEPPAHLDGNEINIPVPQYTEQKLKRLLGNDYTNVKRHYDQTTISFQYLVLRALYPDSATKKNIGPTQYLAELTHHSDNRYLDVKNNTFRLVEMPTWDVVNQSEKEYPVASRCKLTDRGFEIEEFSTDDFDIYYKLRGGFFRRLGTAFHVIFNSSDDVKRSDTAAFFGFPSKENPFNYITGVLFLVTTVKNAVKLVTEFLPAIVEEGFGFLADRAKRHLLKEQNKPANERSALRTSWAYARIGVFSTLQYTFKAIRAVTMRVTSPIRSAKEAYEFGHKYGGKPLGYLLGGLSAVVSTVATAAIAAVAAPIILGGSAAVGALGFVSAVAHLPVVSTIGIALSKTAAVLGVKNFAGYAVTQAAAATAASFAAAATIALAPYRAIKSFIGNLFKNRNTEVPNNEARPISDAVAPSKERSPSIVGDLTGKPGRTSTGNVLDSIREEPDASRANSPTPPPLPPSPLGDAPPRLLPLPSQPAAVAPAAEPTPAPRADADLVASSAPRP